MSEDELMTKITIIAANQITIKKLALNILRKAKNRGRKSVRAYVNASIWFETSLIGTSVEWIVTTGSDTIMNMP